MKHSNLIILLNERADELGKAHCGEINNQWRYLDYSEISHLLAKDELRKLRFEEPITVVEGSGPMYVTFPSTNNEPNVSLNEKIEMINDIALVEIEKDNDDELVQELWNDDDNAEENKERKQWYRDRAIEFEFHTFAPFCSMCGRNEAYYIGITKQGTPFEFCKVCRDELKRMKDQLLAPSERLGV